MRVLSVGKNALVLLVAATSISACMDDVGLNPTDVKYVVPARFGELRAHLFEQGLGCFAVAFSVDKGLNRWGKDELPLGDEGRGTVWPGMMPATPVRYGEWSSGPVPDEIAKGTDLRARAFAVGLGCSPENGGQGEIGALWREIERSGAPVYYAFAGHEKHSPFKYFVGFAPEREMIVIGTFD